MKPIASPVHWIIAATVILLGTGCASTGTKNEAQPATGDNPEPGKGLVIFYRESHFQSGGVGYAVRDFDQKPNDVSKSLRQPRIGALPNGSYFVYQATPGMHVFAGSKIAVWQFGLGSVESAPSCFCSVNVESNTTYYVHAVLAGASIGVPSTTMLSAVDSVEGSAAIKNLKRVTLSK